MAINGNFMNKDLLPPRYEVIADYPGSEYNVGDIFQDLPGAEGWKVWCEKFPHLFRKLLSVEKKEDAVIINRAIYEDNTLSKIVRSCDISIEYCDKYLSKGILEFNSFKQTLTHIKALASKSLPTPSSSREEKGEDEILHLTPEIDKYRGKIRAIAFMDWFLSRGVKYDKKEKVWTIGNKKFPACVTDSGSIEALFNLYQSTWPYSGNDEHTGKQSLTPDN